MVRGYDLDEATLRDATAQYAAGKTCELALGNAVDGEFDIRIDIGHLNAYLTCTLPRGGSPVTLERVLEEVRHKEITVELDLAARSCQAGKKCHVCRKTRRRRV